MSMNGSSGGGDEDTPRPPLTTTTSIKPAMTVVVVAILTLVAFGIIDVATGTSVTPPTTVAVVGGLNIQAHSTVMNGCKDVGPLPSNVETAYIVPVKARAFGTADNESSAADAYDCSQRITAPYPQSEVLGFYASQFHALGWSLFSSGIAPNSNGQDELFNIEGNDTFYWESGVIIDSTSAASTTWTLHFFQDDAID
jgi:hypothetical protein